MSLNSTVGKQLALSHLEINKNRHFHCILNQVKHWGNIGETLGGTASTGTSKVATVGLKCSLPLESGRAASLSPPFLRTTTYFGIDTYPRRASLFFTSHPITLIGLFFSWDSSKVFIAQHFERINSFHPPEFNSMSTIDKEHCSAIHMPPLLAG